MKTHWKIFFILIIFCSAFFGNKDIAFAQSNDEAALAFRHHAPRGEEVPKPGEIMTLHLAIDGLKETTRLLQALVIRDGEPLLLSLRKAYWNEYDIATYDIAVPAPLAELEYQFFLPASDGKTLISNRYRITRECLERVQLDSPIDLNQLPESEHGALLTKQARVLELQLAHYDSAATLLKQIEGSLK